MLKKLFHYFKNKIFSKKINSEFSVIISLQPNYDVDVKLNYPNLNDVDINNIPTIAEQYAELVIYIGSNILKHKLLDMIQDRSYRSEDIKEKLFFDNLVSFHEIITQEIKNHQNTGPLIRPTSVFNIK